MERIKHISTIKLKGNFLFLQFNVIIIKKTNYNGGIVKISKKESED